MAILLKIYLLNYILKTMFSPIKGYVFTKNIASINSF
nr:MAG TPA: CtsR-like protein [Caudoviricetes sp.]